MTGTSDDGRLANRRIGAGAERLDRERTPVGRLRLSRQTLRKIVVVAVLYTVGLLAIFALVARTAGPGALSLLPVVAAAAFVFQSLDSAAGMGFETALAPLLFVPGYEPLQVVPVLLFAQRIIGFVAGYVHQEFGNVHFELDPSNEATKLVVLFATMGALAVVGSIVLVYAAIELDSALIKRYVGAVVGPLLVRVVPNAVWRYVIQGYALPIGLAVIFLGVDA